MNTCLFVPPLYETAFVVLCIAVTSNVWSESPSPTPRPKRSALSAYAGRIALNRPPATGQTETIVISTKTVAELSRSGILVDGVVVVGSGRPTEPNSGASGAEKSRWQTRVRKQRAIIAKLETRRARIEKAIDLINDGRLTPQALARLERAQIDLQFIDEEIRVAYLDLARIIREARQHGAEPGWFR